MEIVFVSIGDRGDFNSERIGFKVLKDCELKYFLVFKTRTTAGGFYNKSNATYWFLPQQVKAGDKIVLYAKSGTDSVTRNSDGSSTYFFYWGLNSIIFQTDEDRVVIASINTWNLVK